MRRVAVLAASALALAALAASAAGPAAAAKPTSSVEASFTAERIGRLCPLCGFGRLGTVTITASALDRTPEFSACPSCAGPDTGTVTETFGPGTGLEGQSFTFPVTDVFVEGTTATVFTETSIYVFHDGGAPGAEIIGPVDPFGLFPTRDSYEQRFWVGPQHFTGYLTSGEITVSPATWRPPLLGR
jgi:hypothetical protein